MDWRPIIIYSLVKLKTYKFTKLEKPIIKLNKPIIKLNKPIIKLENFNFDKSFKHTILYKYNVKQNNN
jgi:hypothetical protein